jgi:hypothetical protein
VEADKDFPAAAASQGFAESAVDEINGLAEEIYEADALGGLPFGARIIGLPTGATQGTTIDCSTLGTSGGSGTLEVSATGSGSSQGSAEIDYNDCSFTSGGITITLDGTVNSTVSDYVDESHFNVTFEFDLTYHIVGLGIDETFEISAAESCSYDGEDVECHYGIGGGYTLDDYDVTVEGDIVTINFASITTANGTIEIEGFTFDLSTGEVSFGSISIEYDNGDSVEIVVGETGYDVSVTIGETLNEYTVPFAS